MINNAELETKTAKRKNCLVYVRVSTDRQVEEGHSLDSQIKNLVNFAKSNDFRILEIFKEEGRSGGTKAGRPEFTRMLERCKNDSDISAVLVEESDRFARNTQDYLSIKVFLQEKKIDLIATEQPNFDNGPVGTFVDTVLAGANQLQRDICAAKTKRIMVAMAEQGLKPGWAPVGYLNSRKKGVPMYPDPEKHYFIKEMFKRWNTNNYTAQRIADELYEEGFRSRMGKKLKKNSVLKRLRDIHYAGKVDYDGKISDGQHKPLITMDEYLKAQKTLKVRNRGIDRTRKYDTLLAGILFCKKCGHQMYAEYHQRGNYYRCKLCKLPYAQMGSIENEVADIMGRTTFSQDALNTLREVLTDIKKQQGQDVPLKLQSLNKRREAIERKMDRLEDQIIEGIIDKERINHKYIPLKEELRQIEAQIERYQTPSVSIKHEDIDKIIEVMGTIGELYEAFNNKQKKQFLKHFINKIWINDEREICKLDWTEPFEILLSRDLVRIRDKWLRGWDSNPQPTG